MEQKVEVKRMIFKTRGDQGLATGDRGKVKRAPQPASSQNSIRRTSDGE